MNHVNYRDIFSTDTFTDMIATEMDNIDNMKNRIPKKNSGDELELVDVAFFKRVLKDVTDISIVKKTLNVYFDRGVDLRFEGVPQSHQKYEHKMRNANYRLFKVMEELVNLRELKLRTSPFVVTLDENQLQARYHQSLDEELHDFSTTINSHDDGLDCWGGWSGPVRANFNELNLENSIIIMIQRMKQLNIDDYAGNITRMARLVNGSHRYEPVKINPIVLARLLTEYDLENEVISGDNKYFTKNTYGKLVMLINIDTVIDYDIFIEVLKGFKRTYTGDKPKIRRSL